MSVTIWLVADHRSGYCPVGREKVKSKEELPDFVIFIGDYNYAGVESVIAALKNRHIYDSTPLFGLKGGKENIDDAFFRKYDIYDLHLKRYKDSGITLGGFGGSPAFEGTDDKFTHTQEACSRQLGLMGGVDLFVSYNPARFQGEEPLKPLPLPKESLLQTIGRKLRKEPSPVYGEMYTWKYARSFDGFLGVGDYIDRERPRIHLYHRRRQGCINFDHNGTFCYRGTGVQSIVINDDFTVKKLK